MKELVRGSFFFYEIGQLRLAFFLSLIFFEKNWLSSRKMVPI